MTITPTIYWYPQHCSGCRCFSSTWPYTITTTPTYQPRHRKPGPAQ